MLMIDWTDILTVFVFVSILFLTKEKNTLGFKLVKVFSFFAIIAAILRFINY